MTLPQTMLEGASAQDEIGWRISDFPRVLREARTHGLACLGGQFQFRFSDGTCEMYWLDADSEDRRANESWDVYVDRSITEVSKNFASVCERANFEEEISSWEFVRKKREEGIDPIQHLWFVAYFVALDEFDNL